MMKPNRTYHHSIALSFLIHLAAKEHLKPHDFKPAFKDQTSLILYLEELADLGYECFPMCSHTDQQGRCKGHRKLLT